MISTPLNLSWKVRSLFPFFEGSFFFDALILKVVFKGLSKSIKKKTTEWIFMAQGNIKQPQKKILLNL